MNQSLNGLHQWAWDATSISLAMTCPRKYQLRILEGYSPKNKSVHLRFGGHYATALEHFYKHRAEGATIDEALARVVREALEDTWDAERGEPYPFEHPAKTRLGLIRAIIWYVDEFADESAAGITTYHLADGKPAVELSFSFEIEDDIVLCGHLDRVVSYADDLYIMDQKTTGSTIGTYFFNSFKPDVQMTLYTLAGKVILNSPVRGVIIDAAQINMNGVRFGRGFTFRTEEEISEWWRGVRQLIAQTHSYADSGFFPMNTTACGNYGGCEFREVCSNTPRIRQQLLDGNYTKHPWDPLKRR